MSLFIAYRDVSGAKYKVFGDFPTAAAWALDGQEKPEFIIDGDQVVPAPAVTPETFRAVYHDLDAALASIADMAPTARRLAAAELHALADALDEFGDSEELAA
ncbi:hypothetical protein [Elstera sp.]|jgi:hypothetical protein|uniref:hypothetical protein n=1 Tax=Elstera sp. TaxID=1916664 RepID=UPI0037BF5126